MKCRKCSARAVINMRHHKLALCNDCFPTWLKNQTLSNIRRMGMFRQKDKVLVCVSGGKDSLALWFVLESLGYQIEAMHVDLGIPEYSQRSRECVKRMGERLEREPIIVDIGRELGITVEDAQKYSKRNPCSVCGIIKRHYMNSVAVERGCDVVATGHNLDDEASTLLMNTLSWNLDYLAHQSPVSPPHDGLVKKVRPFCHFGEREIGIFSFLNGIDWVREECPHVGGSSTMEYKYLLNRMEEDHPGIRRHFYSKFLQARHVFEKENDAELHPCERCGMATSVGVCAFCRAVEQISEAKEKFG